MKDLDILFSAKNGDSITAEQTGIIDAALMQASASDIPDDQIENVVLYLDSNLMHNGAVMSADQRALLSQLRSDLEPRG